MLTSSARQIVVPVLVLLFSFQTAVSQSGPTLIDLAPYRVLRDGQGGEPTGYQLNFVGEAGHRLQFRYVPAEPVELEVSVGFPAGGARTERRLLEPGTHDSAVGFDLGPLLGHGPYRPLPASSHKGPQERVRGYLRTGWWIDTHDTGNYLLTVKGRRVRDGGLLFSNDFRLPVQTWIGADLDRLAYIDDNAAEVELWLRKGAPVRELAVEVDPRGSRHRARAIIHRGGPAHTGQVSCRLRSHRPEGGHVSRAGAAPGGMADSGRTGPAGRCTCTGTGRRRNRNHLCGSRWLPNCSWTTS